MCNITLKHETIKTQAPAMTPIKVTEPLELVEMDYMGPLKHTKVGNRYILTMVDNFTKFVELYPMPSKQPSEVCRKILSFVRRYGAPKRILSDRGGEFVNKMEEADKDTGVVLIPRGDEEPEDDEEPLLDTISAENDDSEMEEDSIPKLFTNKLLLAAACNQERVNQCSERKELTKIVFSQFMENQEQASQKQRKAYEQRTSKGIKTFDLKVGDLVLRQKMSETKEDMVML